MLLDFVSATLCKPFVYQIDGSIICLVSDDSADGLIHGTNSLVLEPVAGFLIFTTQKLEFRGDIALFCVQIGDADEEYGARKLVFEVYSLAEPASDICQQNCSVFCAARLLVLLKHLFAFFVVLDFDENRRDLLYFFKYGFVQYAL